MSSGKRTLPPDALRVARRATADGIAPLVREQYHEPPVESFKAGVDAQRNARSMLREEDIGRSLHEPDELVRFPRHLVDMFRDLGEPEAENLLTLARLKPEELAALIAVARREADKTVFAKVWSRAWKWALGLALPVYGAAKWGADQIPVIKEIIGLLKGHGQ